MELRGNDLTLKEHGDWLTIYHKSSSNSESRSHLHLRKSSYQYACVRENIGYTPQLTFWPTYEGVTDQKPPFAVFFPSFYDWSDGKEPIEINQKYYEDWIQEHGKEFFLTAEEKDGSS